MTDTSSEGEYAPSAEGGSKQRSMNLWMPKKSSKYGNKKIEYNGEVFDSKKEYKRWCELKLLERAGKISDLKRQVKYVLIPSQKGSDGKIVERECSYIADFVYFDREQKKAIVEDTKGMRTKEYIIKRKLMLYVHGISITEI